MTRMTILISLYSPHPLGHCSQFLMEIYMWAFGPILPPGVLSPYSLTLLCHSISPDPFLSSSHVFSLPLPSRHTEPWFSWNPSMTPFLTYTGHFHSYSSLKALSLAFSPTSPLCILSTTSTHQQAHGASAFLRVIRPWCLFSRTPLPYCPAPRPSSHCYLCTPSQTYNNTAAL